MRLHHERAGRGPTLVLIHGLGSHLEAWAPVRGRLEAERHVIAVDLPGFGRSAPLPDGVRPTAAALAEVVGDFLVGLGARLPHLAGNSLGGWVALELARRGQAASVTALSPAGFASEPERRFAVASLSATRWLARNLGGAASRALRLGVGRRLFMGQMAAHPERMNASAAVAASRAFAEAPGLDATMAACTAPGASFRGAAEVTCPVTIAWGDRDLLLPRWQGPRAVAGFRDARLVRLTGCGHVPMWDDPEQVARVILETSAE